VTPAATQVRHASLWRSLAARREFALAVLILLILATVSVRNSDFASPDVVGGILIKCAQPAVVAAGVTLVIVTGEIDISVGASMGFLTAVVGILMSKQLYPQWAPGWAGQQPFSVPSAILITLALGAFIGLLNGILVTLVRVPSIIVTLGMMTILKGLTIMMMRENITDVPESFHFIGTGDLGAALGLHMTLGRLSVWIAALVLLATFALLRYTPLGRRIFAVGSNAHAALLAGISETRIKIFCFAATGFLVGLATILTPVAVFDSGTGEGFELLIVTCVVVGGVSINGGIGTVAGVALGVLLLQMQKTVLIFLKLGADASKWDKAIQGALILAAVLVDHFARRRAGRPRP
jgi:ribose/xylose/arabinose/galactoside ABC-type transport system permease subunit